MGLLSTVSFNEAIEVFFEFSYIEHLPSDFSPSIKFGNFSKNIEKSFVISLRTSLRISLLPLEYVLNVLSMVLH